MVHHVIMKNAAIGIIAIAALIGTPALAADMATKAPPPPSAPAVTDDWTGLYFDVGVGWQNNHFDWSFTNFVPGPQVPFSMSAAQASIAGHIGYQQQFGWLVVGGEWGMFESINGKAATLTANGAVLGPCGNVAGIQCNASISSTSLAGGKLGVDWGNWLFYGVGGAVLNSGIATQVTPGTSGLVFSDHGEPEQTHGWYAGGGFDYLLVKTNFGDLIGGVEYEHINLNTITQCGISVGIVGGCPGTVAAVARVVSATEDAVWGKLTVKLNPLAH